MKPRQHGSSPAFPIGLYATLLLALCWLALPRLWRPVERGLLGLASLPLRALEVCRGEVALAHEQRQLLAAAAVPVAQLRQRLSAHLAAVAGVQHPAALVPVLDFGERGLIGGGGGQPCELRLLRSYRELQGCAPFVTCGEQLLGFLCQPGVGAADRDRPQDPARVLLLNHPQAPAVAAALQLQDGKRLRLCVEAAGSLDPGPLRTSLWDDPYRASRLGGGTFAVRTLRLAGALGGDLPEGLLLGNAEAWGYRGATTLAIGVFVTPSIDFRALSCVAVFGPGFAGPSPLQPQRLPARLQPLPGSLQQRFHVTLAQGAGVPDGAAIVQGDLLLGSVRGLWFGQGLGTAFAASRQSWVLLLLPEEPAAPPLALWGEVESQRGHTAWLRCRGRVPPLQSGWLFTGSNGRCCPLGLLLGRTAPVAGDPTLLELTLPALAAGPVEVLAP